METKIILETPRLILREMELTDAPFFFELNLDPEVIKYTGDDAFKDLEESVERIRYVQAQYQKNGYGRWVVIEKETGDLTGWCGLKYHDDEKFVDLGYRFMQKYWNKGYATEAAKPCIDYGFNVLNLDSIIGRAMNENTGSINVLKKMGMTFLREDKCNEHDAFIFEIKKENYK